MQFAYNCHSRISNRVHSCVFSNRQMKLSNSERSSVWGEIEPNKLRPRRRLFAIYSVTLDKILFSQKINY